MSARAPAVSVLLPVRDGERWLGEALASLEAQTFGDFEVLVQDDGSVDGSAEIAAALAGRDGRFRLERGKALGLVRALARARARARARLLVRMDADDRSRPDRLERLVQAAAAHADVGFFASRVRYFPREGLSDGMRRYEAWLDLCLDHDAIVRERFVECPLPHPAWAIRAETFDGLGGYREGDFPEDYDLFLRAAASGVRFRKLPEVLLDWRERSDRASRRDPRYGLDRFRALKARHLAEVLRAEDGVAFAGDGRGARRWIRLLRASGIAVRVWVTDGAAAPVDGVSTAPWASLARAGARGRARCALAWAPRPEAREALVRRLEAAGFDPVIRLA